MRKRRPFSGNDIVVALVFIPIGLFLLLLGFKATFEARRIADYPVLVSQPDLTRELGMQSPTVRRWCQMLRLEPASSADGQLPIS
jgi:hypothetical protein